MAVRLPPLYDLAALAVLAVWTGMSVTNVLTGDYTGLQLVTPVMLLLAGALFVIRKNGAR